MSCRFHKISGGQDSVLLLHAKSKVIGVLVL